MQFLSKLKLHVHFKTSPTDETDQKNDNIDHLITPKITCVSRFHDKQPFAVMKVSVVLSKQKKWR